MSSQSRFVYHTVCVCECERVCVWERECVSKSKRAKEEERPKEIERKVLGQRLSEIYPHSEACKREDAGSWGLEIRAQTCVISTQTPVREASAPCLRPTLTGGNKTQAGNGRGEKKVYGQNYEREKHSCNLLFVFWEVRTESESCRGCGRAVARLKGDKTPSRFTACLMAYGGSLQHHL